MFKCHLCRGLIDCVAIGRFVSVMAIDVYRSIMICTYFSSLITSLVCVLMTLLVSIFHYYLQISCSTFLLSLCLHF